MSDRAPDIEKLAPHLGGVVMEELRARGARFDPARRADAAALRALLSERGYEPHAAVESFDDLYGGLVIPDDLRDSDMCWWLGAHDFLANGGLGDLRGDTPDVIPVAAKWSDVVYYIDRAGRAFAEDTIEDPG